MFLHILAHNMKYRVVHYSYCRSKETISRQFNNVLRAIMKVSQDYLKFHTYLEGPGENKWRWFEKCVGALDGTHIPVTVSLEDRPKYRNRKGDVSTNVLAACGPDLRFIYVLPGWEGSAGDSRVLRDALRRQNKLEIPAGKYFLVDAGYTNGPGFLAPYRGTRYHLNEWIGNTPQNFKELFNLRHSSARNAIERSFGILKKRWSILRTPSFFDIKTQIRIINACFLAGGVADVSVGLVQPSVAGAMVQLDNALMEMADEQVIKTINLEKLRKASVGLNPVGDGNNLDDPTTDWVQSCTWRMQQLQQL
ncbi:putative nuclease HARBI1 [Cajanus cajan]|uniref:putative nuclease HARBI1 n=1 Tax=Cajanus cajan TaxID=3821 RepID=UPI0010FB480F|nr:putative nuclease HARBI1 [Cajanus cajan]